MGKYCTVHQQATHPGRGRAPTSTDPDREVFHSLLVPTVGAFPRQWGTYSTKQPFRDVWLYHLLRAADRKTECRLLRLSGIEHRALQCSLLFGVVRDSSHPKRFTSSSTSPPVEHPQQTTVVSHLPRRKQRDPRSAPPDSCLSILLGLRNTNHPPCFQRKPPRDNGPSTCSIVTRPAPQASPPWLGRDIQGILEPRGNHTVGETDQFPFPIWG